MQKAVQLLGARKVKHEFSEVTRYDWAKECGGCGFEADILQEEI
jgi:hypothetical protein